MTDAESTPTERLCVLSVHAHPDDEALLRRIFDLTAEDRTKPQDVAREIERCDAALRRLAG